MTDWSKADWVDPAYDWTPKLVSRLPERMLVDFATRCNLRCPMCPVWGAEDEDRINQVRGLMDIDAARRMLDEVSAVKPLIAPSVYGEPLLIPDIREVFSDLKRRGMAIAMNTNGLTLTDALAEFFCEIQVDSVMFSLDAVTNATLKKIRGVSKLEKIESAVFRMMRARGDRELPRVGVSFTVQDGNRHEEEAFTRRWAGVVDVVRVGLVFDSGTGTYPDMKAPEERTPCPAIYQTMPVHNDGSVRLCCLDGMRATDMGNVFNEGVGAVWNGEAFAKARYYHETKQWDEVPFCKNCTGWAQHSFREEIRDGLLIRRSPQYVYYNRIDRLKTWQGNRLGGHKAPPRELVDAPV